MRDGEGAVVFGVVAEGVAVQRVRGAALSALRERIEALGGELTIRAEPENGIYLAGSLPLAS